MTQHIYLVPGGTATIDVGNLISYHQGRVELHVQEDLALLPQLSDLRRAIDDLHVDDAGLPKTKEALDAHLIEFDNRLTSLENNVFSTVQGDFVTTDAMKDMVKKFGADLEKELAEQNSKLDEMAGLLQESRLAMEAMAKTITELQRPVIQYESQF